MAIHDVGVNNTYLLNAIISYELYYSVETTSMSISVEMDTTTAKTLSLGSTFQLIATNISVLQTPIYANFAANITIDSTIIWGKDVSVAFNNTYNITAAVEEFVPLDIRLANYSPRILGDTNIPRTIERTEVGSITLSTESFFLELPKPVFGDTDAIAMTVHSAQLSSGAVVISPLTATNIVSKTYVFEDVCEDIRNQYASFLDITAGQIITMTDFEGYTSDIIISNADEGITEQTLGFDIQMDFEEV